MNSKYKFVDIHMEPLDVINGFEVRPGLYSLNGATAIPTGVNFTIQTHQGTSVELLLFHSEETEPYGVIKIPEEYKIGNVYSMIVFDLDIQDLEYAYRIDGPYDPARGLIFDRKKILLDPYAKAVTGQAEWGTPKDYVYHARVVRENFDWSNSVQILTPIEDLIIYEIPAVKITS